MANQTSPVIQIKDSNVGIGTAAPSYKLQIAEDTYARIALHQTTTGAIWNWGNDGSNMYAYYTNTGVRALDITNTGNVGIGTTAPAYKLEVNGLAAADRYILNSVPTNSFQGSLTAIAGDSTYNILAGPANGPVIRARWSGGTANRYLEFGQTDNGGNYTAGVRIVEGNVGIGTTSPSAKLDVAGTIKVAGNGGGYVEGYRIIWETPDTHRNIGANAFQIENVTSQGLTIGYSSNQFVVVNTSGNVGIGTTSPANSLQIGSVGATGYSGNRLAVGDGTYVVALHPGAVSYLTANGDIVVGAGGNTTNQVYVKSGGNVGIGTTSPISALHILGNQFRIEDNDPTITLKRNVAGAFGGHIDWLTNDNTLGFQIANNALISAAVLEFNHSGVNRMVIKSDGNVGIGTTSPQVKLSVQGTQNNTTIPANAVAKFVGGDAGIFIGNLAGTPNYGAWLQAMRESDGLVFPLHLQPNGGNVGIGTTSPAVKLHVVGTESRFGGVASGYISVYNANSRSGYLQANEGSDFRIASDTNDMTFYVNGSERVRFTAGGNVGIGTASPSRLFDVSAVNPQMTLKSTTTTGFSEYYFSDSVGDPGYLSYAHNGDYLAIGVNSAERMRITSAGNVGIGTTSPSTKLDVIGVGAFGTMTSSRGTYSNGLSIQNNTGEATSLFIWQSGVASAHIGSPANSTSLHIVNSYNTGLITDPNSIVLTNTGNVGIGTTAPVSLLHVNGSNNTTPLTINAGSNAAFEFKGNSTSGYTTTFNINNTALYIGHNSASRNLVLQTASSDRVTITGDGNVGIGTTSPAYKLDVSGQGRFSTTASEATIIAGGASLYNTYIANSVVVGYIGSGQGMVSGGGATNFGVRAESDLLFASGGNAERMRITAGGNVGIGTTAPVVKLQVDGTITSTGVLTAYTSVPSINIGHNGDSAFIAATSGSGANTPISFSVGNNNEKMRITSAGNVGIGTTAPSEKLHVDGSTLVTYNNSFQSTNSVGNKAILARVSPTAGIVNYAEYATAANLNGFVIGSDDARVKGNITGDSLEFITNTSTRMTILSSGNVGINTTTPGSTLHVIGDVLIQTGALGVGVNPNATDGRIDASNDIVAFSTSDRRLKENITPIANALEKVRSLTGVEFDWKEETKSVHGYEGHDVGVIAQDVQAVLPEAVRTNDSGYLSVRYEKMIALLVEANKELADRVEQLEKLIK